MDDIKLKKLYQQSFKCAVESINTCYHPKCDNISINSHILQKNGILNKISNNNHVIELNRNLFYNPPYYFKKTGINKAFSFKCFCNEHDSKLFNKIENEIINFDDYECCLLFTIRTIYNEIWRKEVSIKVFENLIDVGEISKDVSDHFRRSVIQFKEGIKDLKKTEMIIWNDLEKKEESFVFLNRDLNQIDICMSSFFSYETTKEIHEHLYSTGRHLEYICPIFINLFPFERNSKLLMGYLKNDSIKVKGFINTFFKEKEKRVQRKITNLLILQCETWVISNSLYKKQIIDVEENFINCIIGGMTTYNERKNHDINLFDMKFKHKLIALERSINLE